MISRRGRALGRALVLAFFPLVGALHLLRPDLDPGTRTLSEYALGPWGALMQVAFVALAAGGALLGAAARAGGGARSRVVAAALFAFALGMAVDAAVPTEPYGRVTTLGGLVHAAGAGLAFAGLVAAQVTRARDALAAAACLGLELAVFGIGAAAGAGFGWLERGFTAVGLGWLALGCLEPSAPAPS